MTEPRWVKLSERKPTKKGYYYFYDPKACNEEKIFARWFFPAPDWASHWLEMELPPLPKEEKPFDSDWENLLDIYNMWAKHKTTNEDMICQILRFLRAKYGK